MLSLKGDLDKKTKGTPKSFERSLEENTAILENLVTKLRIWGVLETKHLPGLQAIVIVRWKQKFSALKRSESLQVKCLLHRSKDMIEIISSWSAFKPFNIYYFTLFCWRGVRRGRMRVDRSYGGFSWCTSGSCADFSHCLVGSLCVTRVWVEGDFLGWFFGRGGSTYTRVNTVIS